MRAFAGCPGEMAECPAPCAKLGDKGLPDGVRFPKSDAVADTCFRDGGHRLAEAYR